MLRFTDRFFQLAEVGNLTLATSFIPALVSMSPFIFDGSFFVFSLIHVLS